MAWNKVEFARNSGGSDQTCHRRLRIAWLCHVLEFRSRWSFVSSSWLCPSLHRRRKIARYVLLGSVSPLREVVFPLHGTWLAHQSSRPLGASSRAVRRSECMAPPPHVRAIPQRQRPCELCSWTPALRTKFGSQQAALSVVTTKNGTVKSSWI